VGECKELMKTLNQMGFHMFSFHYSILSANIFIRISITVPESAVQPPKENNLDPVNKPPLL
jgi:hypothetical protein